MRHAACLVSISIYDNLTRDQRMLVTHIIGHCECGVGYTATDGGVCHVRCEVCKNLCEIRDVDEYNVCYSCRAGEADS